MNSPRLFERYVGIDYSGAQRARDHLKGLRVYRADAAFAPAEVLPHHRYWTRRDIAEWLVELFGDGVPTLVGIDHGFSFPLQYFEKYRLAHDWPAFLDDFQQHWPTDRDIAVEFVRDGITGNGAARCGNSRWRRLTEICSGSAKSVFHFDAPGSVAKSTHSGLPWLRYIRQHHPEQVHFWPFDGWAFSPGRSVIVEAYPALWKAQFPPEDRDVHQHDAYAVAAWMRQADRDGSLGACFRPELPTQDLKTAEIEGWILGVQPREMAVKKIPRAPREPRVGVGGVLLAGNRVLLQRRKKAPDAGMWSLPGGRVEFMERVEDALIREFHEELGVGVEVEDLLCVTNHLVPAGPAHWVSLAYRVRLVSGKPENLEPHKTFSIQWFDLSHLPNNLSLVARAALQALGTRSQI